MKKSRKKLWLFSTAGVFVAGLCCLTPIIMVMLGLASVAVAASYADLFYGTYRWAFRSAGLIFLGIGLYYYFKSQGICTLDSAKKNRNKIINTTILVLISATLLYVIWLYGVVELIGKWMGIW